MNYINSDDSAVVSAVMYSMIYIDLPSAVCKFKAHKRCAVRSTNNCKWTTLASIGNDIIEDEEGVSDQAYCTFKSL